jgi:hypothetical protein
MWFGRDPGGWHDGASGSRRHRPPSVSGRDPGGWHDGASGSRRHRPARVAGHNPGNRHDGRFSAAITPVWHAGSARDTPWIRPPNVGITRRCWLPSGAVGLTAQQAVMIAPRLGAAPAASRTSTHTLAGTPHQRTPTIAGFGRSSQDAVLGRLDVRIDCMSALDMPIHELSRVVGVLT